MTATVEQLRLAGDGRAWKRWGPYLSERAWGTVRFGHDPATSALDVNCKMHELDNVYVVDSSFFVSSSAVNPTLTIIANALRVADHLLARLAGAEA